MRSLFLTAVAALLAACGPKDARFKVRESVEQLHVTHATPGAELVVVDAKGHEAASGTADELGSLMFRNLAPGEGYRVRTRAKPVEETHALKVLSVEESYPPERFYEAQVLHAGLN